MDLNTLINARLEMMGNEDHQALAVRMVIQEKKLLHKQ